jgi:hypothetical protein
MLSKIFAALLLVGAFFFVACVVESPTEPSGKNDNSGPNQNPKVASVTADPASVSPGQRSTITVTASDADNDQLSYSYSVTGGTISGSGKTATFVAGNAAGTAYVTVTISDGRGGTAGGYVIITIR